MLSCCHDGVKEAAMSQSSVERKRSEEVGRGHGQTKKIGGLPTIQSIESNRTKKRNAIEARASEADLTFHAIALASAAAAAVHPNFELSAFSRH